jgi:metallo-beta-lactamase class B
MLTASCLVAASLFGPAAFAQNLEAEAAAARAAAAAAVARANAQVSPNDPLEKICRIGPRSREVEVQKMEPFKVFDNLYHVGPCYVSSWVLKTPQGGILFDTAQEPYVDTVIENIRKVGFDPKNIKYILLSHGHLDHYGGATKIQKLSGARVALTEADWNFMATQEANAAKNGRGVKPGDEAPKKDMVIKEGDTVTLGKTAIKVYTMPGHTPGSASFEFTVYDNGRPHKALVFGGPGQRNGVEGGTQFLESIRRLKSKEFADVEVPVHVHSWLTTYPDPRGGTVFEPAMQLAKRQPGQPHPFVIPDQWKQWLDRAEAGTIKYVEDAKAGKAAPVSN